MLTFGERAIVSVSGWFVLGQYTFPRKAVIKTEGQKEGGEKQWFELSKTLKEALVY